MEASQARLSAPPDRIVVVGASAGGVEALVKVVGGLPEELDCAVLVVLHVAPSGTSVLPQILARSTGLTVLAAQDGDVLRPNHVYVARPDRHLLVEGAHVRLAQTPRENGHRPAIDPTMRTAARAFGAGAVGIVLSGSRDDGTAGLLAIKQAGGLAAAQDPEESLYDDMPRSAARHVELDAVLRAHALGEWIGQTCRDARREPLLAVTDGALEPERRPDKSPQDAGDLREAVASVGGEATRFTCPDCGGVLFETEDGSLLRYECSVGHAFSVDSLDAEQAHAVENALWTAVRTLEDRVTLVGRLADRARDAGNLRSAARFERQGRELAARSHTIRGAIDRLTLPVEVEEA